MINANELRVGNRLTNGVVHSIERGLGVSFEADEEMIVFFDKLEPIPITPDILISCGFEKHSSSSDFWKNQDYEFYGNGSNHGSFAIAYYEGEFHKYFACEDDEYSWTGHRIKHLHQLQNLYFCLTGKELEYLPT